MDVSTDELIKFKEYFKNYGTVQPLLNETGMHRLTLKRLLEKGRATEDTIVKVRTYIKKQSFSVNELE